MRAGTVRFAMLIVLALTVHGTLRAHGNEPIHVHPDNPHYFEYRGRPTVLITSGEHYGAVLNQDFDYETYLAELEKHDLNLTRTFAGTYAESWGEGWNTLNPAAGRFITPWARSDSSGYADGGNKFDLSEWNPRYFRRLRDFLSEARDRGVMVELVLFCVMYGDSQWQLCPMNARNNINGIGDVGRKEFFDMENDKLIRAQVRVARKIAREVKDFDNVYLELCNEPYFANGPELGDPWNDRMVEAIRSVTDDHMIALNVANNWQKVEKVPEGISLLNFHYCRPPKVVDMNYGLDCPIAYDESGFKGPGAANYRRYAWDFVVAGGAVFSNLDYTFTVDSPQGQSRAADPDRGCQEPAIRPQLGVLKDFIESFDFVKMKPADDIIQGSPEEASVQVLAEKGHQYAVYVKGGTEARLQLTLPAGTYSVEWIVPRTGQGAREKTLKHNGGAAALNVSQSDSGMALRILRQK